MGLYWLIHSGPEELFKVSCGPWINIRPLFSRVCNKDQRKKLLAKMRLGVNFINILRAPFAPIIYKRLQSQTYLEKIRSIRFRTKKSMSPTFSEQFFGQFPFNKKLKNFFTASKLKVYKTFLSEKMLLKCWQNWDLGLISPTFYEQLFHQYFFAEKLQRQTVIR